MTLESPRTSQVSPPRHSELASVLTEQHVATQPDRFSSSLLFGLPPDPQASSEPGAVPGHRGSPGVVCNKQLVEEV